ncbi:MAG: single-stranded DNA-binding protein [Prevotella sp.]
MATNKVNLVGRLGKDPEFHYIDKNTTVCRLRLAVNDCDYDANGNKGKYTTWITIVLWNRLAFVAKNGLCKGAAIAVEGRLSNNSYVDKEGTKHYQLQVEAERIECLYKPSRLEQPTAANLEEKDFSGIVSAVNEENSDEAFMDENGDHDGDVVKKLSIKDFEMPEKGKRKSKQ